LALEGSSNRLSCEVSSSRLAFSALSRNVNTWNAKSSNRQIFDPSSKKVFAYMYLAPGQIFNLRNCQLSA